MKIKIICVGKLKEKYLKEALCEYSKRLSKFCIFEIKEVPDEKIPDNASKSDEEIILKKEGKKIAECLEKNDHIIAMCVEGKQKSSLEFAKYISQTALSGKSSIAFIIGGSLGLFEDIKKLAHLKLSISEMTFPHQLMRVILSEQIYRAFKINSGEKYHK